MRNWTISLIKDGAAIKSFEVSGEADLNEREAAHLLSADEMTREEGKKRCDCLELLNDAGFDVEVREH